MRLYISFISVLFFCSPIFTQKCINGKLNASATMDFSEVNVLLLRFRDKKFLASTLAEKDGTFNLCVKNEDSVLVAIQHPDFEAYLSDLIRLNLEQTQLKLISLTAKGGQLEAVTVAGKKQYIERKADKILVNPDALIGNAGSNALDALAKSPGVMIDQNGTIKLKGKSGVLILIDNKPTYLNGEELANYLKTLPADAVKQFELMTNPPAKYDAAGNSGIINIITKKTTRGVAGSVTASYAQGRYARTNNNANFSIQGKKLGLFSNFGGGVQNSFHDLYIERQYRNADNSIASTFVQNSYIKPHSESFNGRIGLDYYVTPKTTLGILAKGVSSFSNVKTKNTAERRDSVGELFTSILANNFDREKMYNGSFNFNVRHDLDTLGQQLTFDADYVRYSTRMNQGFLNTFYTPDGIPFYADLQGGRLPSEIGIVALKSDYIKPFKNGAQFEAGVKSSFTNTDNTADYSLTINDVTSPNYDLSNQFIYKEQIHAAYANYSTTYKRISIQAGLRLESTQLIGNQLGNPIKPASEFKRNYTNLFPTLFVSLPVDSAQKHVLNFNYGRRINRPYFQDLNPFSAPLDKFTFYEGNPYLLPTFAHALSFGYSYNQWLNTTFSYTLNTNQIQETIEIKKGIYYSRPGNVGFSEIANLSVEASIPVKKWLTTVLYSETQYGHYKSDLYGQNLNSRGIYWYINFNNTFTLKKGYTLEWTGEYITNFIDSQFKFGDFGHTSIGASKRVLKEKLNIRIHISDLLFSNKIRGRINNLSQTTANWYGPRDTRVVTFTLSYRFGKSTRKQRTTFGSEAEQNRVK